MAAAMQLRFLYVDLRLPDQLPPYGSYLFSGETGEGEQFHRSPTRQGRFRAAHQTSVPAWPGVDLRPAWAGRARTAQRLVPALTGVGLVAGLCLFSLALLITGVWLTPVTILFATSVIGMVP